MIYTSGVIAEASGSVGGWVFSHNRGGAYIRTRASVTNPNTVPQQIVRDIFASLAVVWVTLSLAEREAWETYAINTPVVGRGGRTITLTGRSWYIKANTVRLQAGLAREDTAPINFGLAQLSAVSLEISVAADNVAITFDETDPWVNNDGAGLAVYTSRDLKPTVNFFKGPYQFAGLLAGATVLPPTSPDSSLTSAFGHTVGNRTAFRVFALQADGRVSAVQFDGPAQNQA